MRKGVKDADYKFLGNCPICSIKFTGATTFELARGQRVQTLYTECKKCKSSVVLGISKNIPGIVTIVGMLTDMKKEDINRLKSMEPITADDVLEIHQQLTSYK